MNPSLQIRRAVVDDLNALRVIWNSLRLPSDEFEKRLKEFQVIESDGQIIGAIGFRIQRQHALLFGEAYSDFGLADEARKLFWERIQIIAANHSIFRIWTQENSPFWKRWGFQPTNAELLERLPADWKNSEENWFTLQLKDEDAINSALKNQFAGFMDEEKKQTALISEKASRIKLIFSVICFGIFFLCMIALFFLLKYRNPFSPH